MSHVSEKSKIMENTPDFHSATYFHAIEKKKPDSVIEDEEILYKKEVFKTESFSKTKKITFSLKICKTECFEENLQNKLPQLIEENKKTIRKTQRNSSIIKSLIFLDIRWQEKLQVFVKAYLIPHLLTDLLVTLVTLSHLYYKEYCFMKPLCSCDNDIRKKIYTVAIQMLSNHGIFVVAEYFCLIGVFLSDYRKLNIIVFICYFSIVMTLETGYIAWSSEEESFNEWPIHIMNFIASSLFLSIIVSIKYKFNFKEVQKNLFKISIFSNCLFFHYFLIRFVFPYLNNQIPYHLANYLIPLYQIFYFRIMNSVAYKALYIYYNYASTLTKSLPSVVINSQMRYFQTFLLSVPLASILNFKIQIEGIIQWLLLLSYANCLVLIFTRVDMFAKYVYIPLYRKIFRPKQIKIPRKLEENELKCQLIISGNLLDVIYLFSMRLLFWVIFKIWIIHPFQLKYYKNCGFEMDFSTFQVNSVGIITVVAVNSLITLAVFIFMKLKKTLLFEYKMEENMSAKILNVFTFLLLSVIIDNNIQISYSI